MKVLYCNPIFFEYRLPFYEELVRLFKGQFYVIYSVNRYDICGKSKFCKQIKEKLKNFNKKKEVNIDKNGRDS